MSVKPFLTTEWLHLAMLNYEIDPAILRPFVPRGTELDEFNGRYFVSMVGFLFRKPRLLGIPIPAHGNFQEVILSCYVSHRIAEGWRRGVVFIKEIVQRRLVAIVANKLYDEKFTTLPVRSTIVNHANDSIRVKYEWLHAKDWHSLEITTEGMAAIPSPGSETEFIAEHYWAYTARRDGSTSEYRVDHPPWRVSAAKSAEFCCDVASIYGNAFVESLTAKPSFAFLAEGSPVGVYRERRF